MPNWCENKLVIKGKSEELVKLIKDHVVDDELDYKTFDIDFRLFGENIFDCDEILKEKIEEITFWFSTKWTPQPSRWVCDILFEEYPSLEVELAFFSVESTFWGYYGKDRNESYRFDDDDDESVNAFLEFGEKEGFLFKTEDEKYDFTHDVPTFRLI